MLDAMTWAGAWLVQRSAALPDTIVTKQIATAPNVFDRITGIASGLLTIAFLILVAAAVPAAWNFRKSYKKVNRLADRLMNDLDPIIRHANAVADNINYITTSIRHDVQQINATIASANERLQDAVEVTERRLGDFNALLKVVQEEAESMFVSTASAVRGVRTSASALSEVGAGPKFAGQDEDDVDELELGSQSDPEEDLTDGYDSDAAASENDVARPRLRPKRRVGRPSERGPGTVRPRSG
jgi:uncharacterized protein YoxC